MGFDVIDKVMHTIRKYLYRPQWRDIEYFDESWKIRIRAMSELIEEEKEVMDLGCGKMWLKGYLSDDVKYSGCDYVKRDDDTIVCDFNQGQFPVNAVELIFVSGCLEYVENVEWFVESISKHCSSLIISYCTVELNPDINARKSLGWKNHLTLQQLLEILLSNGFALFRIISTIDGNIVLKLRITTKRYIDSGYDTN